MIAFFQSLGIVFSLIVVVILTLATMYLSYVVAIAILLGGLIYVVYSILQLIRSSSYQTN